MSAMIALIKWSDQGVRNYRDTVSRAEQSQERAGRFGVKLTWIYWTPGGRYDIVALFEGDDEKIAAFQLELESMGNLRITSARAYGPDEMRKVVSSGQ